VVSLGNVVGQADFMVDSSKFAYVIALDVLPFKSLSVTATSAIGLSFDDWVAEISIFYAPLKFEGDVEYLVTSAVFDDLTRMEITPADGLLYSATDANLEIQGEATVSVAVGAVSSNQSLVVASFVPSGMCNENVIGTGNTSFGIDLEAPQQLIARVSNNVLSFDGDAAILAGVSSSIDIVVELVFASGRVVDVTNDARTLFDLSSSGGLFVVQGDTIVASSNGTAGSGELIVIFQGTTLKTQAVITVVKAVALTTTAVAYPAYDGSADTTIDLLSRIGGTAGAHYEEASLVSVLALSNGDLLDLDSASVQYTAFSEKTGEISAVTRIDVDIVRPSAAEFVRVVSQFGGLSGALLLNVTSDEVFVADLFNMRTSTGIHLQGGQGQQAALLDVSATMTNGRQYRSLFQNGVAVFEGILLLSSADAAVVRVNTSTGVVSLFKNVKATLQLSASTLDAVTTSVAVTGNLIPDVGDLDFGEPVGAPGKPVGLETAFEVPVRVNTGDLFVGSFDFIVGFNASLVSVVNVRKSFTSGFVDYRVSDGQIRIAGSIDDDQSGGRSFGLVLITFKSLSSSGSLALSGTILRLAQPDLDGTAIGSGDTSRTVVAGLIELDVGSGVGRRSSLQSVLPVMHERRRSADCEVGDVNGDCIFDVVDVRFILIYVVERVEGFASSRGQDIGNRVANESSLDIDGNGQVNAKDASYLSAINIGSFFFLGTPSIASVEDSSDCLLTISVTLADKLGAAPLNESFIVFFDISHTNASFTSEVNQSAVVTGSLVTLDRGNSQLYGGIFKAELVNATSGEYVVQLQAAFSRQDIGLSVVQISRDSLSTNVRFLGGSEVGLPVYGRQLSATVSAFGQSVSITSSGLQGFNPLMTFDNNLESSQRSCGGLLVIIFKAINSFFLKLLLRQLFLLVASLVLSSVFSHF
jgi:hypothetical protein